MQSCGGCGGRSLFSGVDRLVALLVLQLFGDIGRQGHLTHPVKQREEIALFSVVVKSDQPVALGRAF